MVAAVGLELDGGSNGGPLGVRWLQRRPLRYLAPNMHHRKLTENFADFTSDVMISEIITWPGLFDTSQTHHV
ncbi:hypothetical protein OROHE_003732 [Orobanche hederae]